MNDELKVRLKEFQLTDEQIGKLEAEGVKSVDDLALLTADDIKALTGCGLVAAKKIAAAYAAKAEPVTAMPQTIVVKSGRPEDMAFRELLQAVVDGEHSADYVNALRQRTRNMRVFVRKPGEEGIDVVATMEVIDFADQPGSEPEFWGEQPTETLDEVLERRKQANPITGAALAKGDAWLDVDEDRRVLAAYARLAGNLRGNEDEYTLINELKSETLTGRWPRIKAAFDRAEKAHDPLVDQARSALFYSKGGRPGSTQTPFRQPSSTIRAGGVNITGPGNINVAGDIAGRDIRRG